jgi:hypothetical protein
LVNRFRKFNKRVIAPLHCHQSTWNKHGYLCLSPPDFDPDIDITIYMDIARSRGYPNDDQSHQLESDLVRRKSSRFTIL